MHLGFVDLSPIAQAARTRHRVVAVLALPILTSCNERQQHAQAPSAHRHSALTSDKQHRSASRVDIECSTRHVMSATRLRNKKTKTTVVGRGESVATKPKPEPALSVAKFSTPASSRKSFCTNHTTSSATTSKRKIRNQAHFDHLYFCCFTFARFCHV